MNNKRVFFAVLAFATALLAACGSTIPTLKPYHVEVQQGNVVDEKMLGQLHPGMTKSQVRYILGTPLIQDSFHQNRWDYFYQIRKDGKISDQRRIIVDFENDALKGIRGDVVSAGKAGAFDDAAMATLATDKKSNPPAEEKSFWESLKFWGDDEKPATKLEPSKPTVESKPAVESKPEESKKSFWNRLKFWEGDDKPAPKADKASDAISVLMNKSALAQQLLISTFTASEVADVSQQKEEVTAAVNAWADAWRKKDTKSYLAAYSDQFVPEGFSSKKAWAAQRKQRIQHAKAIKLSLENLNVELADQIATVTFDQIYSASHFSDHMTKTLQLAYAENHWLIVKESAGVAVTKSEKKADAVNVASASSTAEQQTTAPKADAAESKVSPSEVVVEIKDTAVKAEAGKSENNSSSNEPNIFERMLEKIGF